MLYLGVWMGYVSYLEKTAGELKLEVLQATVRGFVAVGAVFWEREFIPAKDALRELIIWVVADKEDFQEQKKTKLENRNNAASQAVK